MTEPTLDTRVSLLEKDGVNINSKLDTILNFIKECRDKELNYIKEINTIKTEQAIIKTRINVVASIFTVILIPLIVSTIPVLLNHYIETTPHQHQIDIA